MSKPKIIDADGYELFYSASLILYGDEFTIENVSTDEGGTDSNLVPFKFHFQKNDQVGSSKIDIKVIPLSGGSSSEVQHLEIIAENLNSKFGEAGVKRIEFYSNSIKKYSFSLGLFSQVLDDKGSIRKVEVFIFKKQIA